MQEHIIYNACLLKTINSSMLTYQGSGQTGSAPPNTLGSNERVQRPQLAKYGIGGGKPRQCCYQVGWSDTIFYKHVKNVTGSKDMLQTKFANTNVSQG